MTNTSLPPISPDQRATLMRRATYASVSVAASLILAKLIGWWMTESISILASLLDSVLDVMASIVNLVAVRYALQPPDEDHRFGHGKAEPLASLGQSLIIAVSSLILIRHAFDYMSNDHLMLHPKIGAGIMIYSLCATFSLVLYQKHVVAQTGSPAIKADALHYLSDLLSQSATLLVMVLATFGWHQSDPYIALGIGIYVFYSAWEIAKESFQSLMDQELPDETRQKIINIVKSHDQVRGLHDLKTRSSGHNFFIQLHLELDDNMPLIQAHDISDEVEACLIKAFPHAEIMIHQDPVSLYRRNDPKHTAPKQFDAE